MPVREESYKVYPERVDGPNEERGIAAGDWRDKDEILDVAGCHIVKLDQTDEDSPVVVQKANGETVDIEGWIDQHEGKVLVLPIIARDEQRHN